MGLDLARFVAIVGMMCVHLMPTAGTPGAVEWLSSITEGNASTLFAVIGGVSVVLATRRYLEHGHGAAARWALLTRALLVMILGATLGLMPGNIVVVLVYFGAAMIFCIPLLGVRPSRLLAGAGLLAALGPIANAMLRSSLQVVDEGGSLGWNTVIGDPLGAGRAVLITGMYPVVTWLVYLLVGMAFATWLLDARRDGSQTRLLRRAAVVGASATAAAFAISWLLATVGGQAAMVSSLPGLTPEQLTMLTRSPGFGAPFSSDWWALALRTPHTGTTLDILRGTGLAVLVISLLLMATARLPKNAARVTEPLRAAGAAPLTVYTLHVAAAGLTTVALQLLVEGGATLTGYPWWYSGPVIVAVHVTAAIAVGAVLALLDRRGPLEAFVSGCSRRAARRLTRG
ncbi:heparan-alpha-glucosaminide N-acetyltransferase domain-containing protein [Frigoribacterium sp. VKM Ac-2836]|uniref:heparan-alpha-glucosaminide N-acetyltransferase domain-containing protein n=1 Tax=Frigoribacterium sp. VKM Ac-2836 TaxID=2739014 RepID=UPI00352D4E59